MMDAHRLVLPEHTMCTQLRQPDVEEVMALCLTTRREAKYRELKKTTKQKKKEKKGKAIETKLFW